MKNLRFTILSILLLVLGSPMAAQSLTPAIVLKDSGLVEPRFDRDVSFFMDHRRRFDQDQQGLLDQAFILGSRPEQIAIGFSTGILWGRFRIAHHGIHDEPLVLSFHKGSPTRVRLFEHRQGKIQEIVRQGGGYSKDKQVFLGLGNNLPLLVSPGEHEYLIAQETNGGRLGFAFQLSRSTDWAEEIAFPKFMAKGAFFGTLFTLFIFHFFVFINTRDKAYGLYLCYILSVIALFLNIEGILDRLVPWPEQGGWTVIAAFFAGILTILLTMINKTYYDSKKSYPRINRLFDVTLVSGIILVLATPFTPVTVINRVLDIVAGYGLTVLFFASAYVWRKGYNPAKYLFISRLIFTSFVTIFMLHLYGIFPDNFLTNYSLHIGCLCDLLVMSYGLGLRMRMLEIEKLEAREGERQASFKLNWFNTLVRVITHDLSTPVSVITASADMELRRAQPSASLQKNLERIARASKQQTNLINHVRDMLAVASGKKELELKAVCLNQALEEAIATLSELAESKQIRVDLKLPTGQVYVAADPTALVSTVFDNFLSNAIKFSKPGSMVQLILDSNTDSALIKIIDTGIGIPEDLMQYLFDPAHATSRPGTAKEIGTGFGLPLAKAYIEHFHGQVLVESHVSESNEAESGTCFTIVLPLISGNLLPEAEQKIRA